MNKQSLGFTGTREGMRPAQMLSFLEFLGRRGFTEFHHGGAIGADEEAHWLVSHLFPDTQIHVWPDERRKDHKSRLHPGSYVLYKGEPPLKRNKFIVEHSALMVACIAGPEHDNPRSGTWATVRHARKTKTPCWIISPTGQIRKDSA